MFTIFSSNTLSTSPSTTQFHPQPSIINLLQRTKLLLYIPFIPLLLLNLKLKDNKFSSLFSKPISYLSSSLTNHLFTHNGYVLTKLGQYLSILDKDINHLQNKCKQHSYEETMKIMKEVENEYKIEIAEEKELLIKNRNTFDKILTLFEINTTKNKPTIIITSKKPLYSGSIAQLYKWYLYNNNNLHPIAVKIVHPHIPSILQSDLFLLTLLSKLNIKYLRSLNLLPFFKNISIDINNQIDMKKERMNIDIFKKQNNIEILESIKNLLLNKERELVDKYNSNSKELVDKYNTNSKELDDKYNSNSNINNTTNNSITNIFNIFNTTNKYKTITKRIINIIDNINNIRIPKVYYATNNILIEEYINSSTITNRNIQLLYNSIIRMIDNRFIHIDLHPGNILLKSNNRKDKELDSLKDSKCKDSKDNTNNRTNTFTNNRTNTYTNNTNTFTNKYNDIPSIIDYGLVKVLTNTKYNNLRDLIRIIINREPIVGNILIDRLDSNKDTNKYKFNIAMNNLMNKIYSIIDNKRNNNNSIRDNDNTTNSIRDYNSSNNSIRDIDSITNNSMRDYNSSNNSTTNSITTNNSSTNTIYTNITIELLNILNKYNIKLDSIYNSIIVSILCLDKYISSCININRNNIIVRSLYKEVPLLFLFNR